MFNKNSNWIGRWHGCRWWQRGGDIRCSKTALQHSTFFVWNYIIESCEYWRIVLVCLWFDFVVIFFGFDIRCWPQSRNIWISISWIFSMFAKNQFICFPKIQTIQSIFETQLSIVTKRTKSFSHVRRLRTKVTKFKSFETNVRRTNINNAGGL